MKSLSIDLETYSSVDLKSCGVFKYCEVDDFQILLFAYAFDEDPVEVVDLTVRSDLPVNERLPQHLIDALTDPSILKRAYNAQFERTCLSHALNIYLHPDQWHCTMALASAAGLPGNLSDVARVLGLDQQKMTVGKALIQYFCKPCTPTKTNHQRTRNLPRHDPAKWELFKQYNAQDVETERDVFKHIDYAFTPTERAVYVLDQEINDRGIRIDLQMVEAILQYNAIYSEQLTSRAAMLSGLDNPNSRNQLVAWLKEQDINVDNIRADTISDLIQVTDNVDVAEMLKLRQEMAKSSLKKYDTMDRATCADGRIRGTLQYYGASRTGRWAGRLVQVQNLPRTYLSNITAIRDLVKQGDFDALECIYDSPIDLFSQLIRTAFIPDDENLFVVCDYSAIEARVIAWLANETWRLDVFRTHGKIYEASASQMFNIPLNEVDKSVRAKGKVAELALGYNGGPGALIKMGALDSGLNESDLPGLVRAWRKASPGICKLWKSVEACALRVLDIPNAKVNLKTVHPGCPINVIFSMNGKTMEVELPSGRILSYYNARPIGDGPYTRIQYEGLNQETKRWMKTESYGGKLVENLTSAIARDCLAETMLRIDSKNLKIAFHVHDEVVVEIKKELAAQAFQSMRTIMSTPIDWAPNLPLKAEGFIDRIYRKD